MLSCVLYQQPWLTEKLPANWKLANIAPISQEGWKGDPSNYRSVSLSSVLEKVIKEIILSATAQHIQDNQRINPSQ